MDTLVKALGKNLRERRGELSQVRFAKKLGIAPERVIVTIEEHGNTSAASVPLALDEANREGRIKDGDYLVMVAFGGGLIWGATLVKW